MDIHEGGFIHGDVLTERHNDESTGTIEERDAAPREEDIYHGQQSLACMAEGWFQQVGSLATEALVVCFALASRNEAMS